LTGSAARVDQVVHLQVRALRMTGAYGTVPVRPLPVLDTTDASA
jgi:hypothetical protein